MAPRIYTKTPDDLTSAQAEALGEELAGLVSVSADRGRLFVTHSPGGAVVGRRVRRKLERLRFHQPVDDLIALGEVVLPAKGKWPRKASGEWRDASTTPVEADFARIWRAYLDYEPLFGWGTPELFVELVRTWRRQGLPKLFLDAAVTVSNGRLPTSLAPYLEQIRFPVGQNREFTTWDAVPTLPALAAWTLLRAFDHREFVVIECELCGMPWLASTAEARYCHRLAPESLKVSCLESGRVRDHRAKLAEAKQLLDEGPLTKAERSRLLKPKKGVTDG